MDRAVTPSSRDVVVAILDGELTVKRLVKREGGITELHPENDDYDVIRMRPGSELEIWGTVTGVIRKFKSVVLVATLASPDCYGGLQQLLRVLSAGLQA